MKKILFDASIHLGQFDIENEERRISCKNSQASISEKSGEGLIGYYTFNENGWMDKIIWFLERKAQDAFYPFMDNYFSTRNIAGIPLSQKNLVLAQELSTKFPKLDISNALSCSVAISNNINIIHTYYPTLLDRSIVEYMKKNNIAITFPPSSKELLFTQNKNPDIETLYQAALREFKKNKVKIFTRLHG
jgi:hypothetical protein